MTAAPGPRFGANYVPSSNWFYSWLDFSADDVARDFDDLASIGLDHVRVFPMWPWIQPNRGHIRKQPVRDLLTVIDLAAQRGLDVAVDLLQGHMSSFDFLPSWVLTHHHRSIFEDADVRSGIATYMEEVSQEVAAAPNVFAITLGNEVNNLVPFYTAGSEATRGWAKELLEVVAAAAPGKLHLYSVYDAAWYSPDHPFDPADSTDLGSLTTVHSWIFSGASDIDGPLGPATVSHADYLIELAAATAAEPRRPVWLQEVGAPRPHVPAAEAGEFTALTLDHIEANPALWGVTWWCSHDLDRRLLDFPDHEYGLGLFTVDHEAKPAARALEAFIKRQRVAATARPALVCPIDPRIHPERRDQIAPGSRFHLDWVRQRRSGPVAIVPPGDRADSAYLAARGIDRVIVPLSAGPPDGVALPVPGQHRAVGRHRRNGAVGGRSVVVDSAQHRQWPQFAVVESRQRFLPPVQGAVDVPRVVDGLGEDAVESLGTFLAGDVPPEFALVVPDQHPVAGDVDDPGGLSAIERNVAALAVAVPDPGFLVRIEYAFGAGVLLPPDHDAVFRHVGQGGIHVVVGVEPDRRGDALRLVPLDELTVGPLADDHAALVDRDGGRPVLAQFPHPAVLPAPAEDGLLLTTGDGGAHDRAAVGDVADLVRLILVQALELDRLSMAPQARQPGRAGGDDVLALGADTPWQDGRVRVG